jgi:hypothetical protein
VTLSLRETFDLFRAAMPPTAHDASSRRSHALLIITTRYLLDTLRAIDSNEIPPGAIEAAELVGRQVRIWLRKAKRAAEKPTRRPAPATAQTTLLLPLNRIAIQRHKADTLHNAVPVCSQQNPDFTPADPAKAETGTTILAKPRRTA